MINRYKLHQKITDSYNTQATTQQKSVFADQNNYSFSSKQTPCLQQKTNTSRIDMNTYVNKRRNSSSALSSKESNIKTIDQKIQAILKKHTGQKDLLQDLLDAKETTLNTNKVSKESEKQFIQLKSKENYANRSTKKESLVPQFGQSQLSTNRAYASLKKQEKHAKSQNKNDHKFDQKIQMLTERIKKAQEEKKKLNIKFKPFAFDGIPATEHKQQQNQKQLSSLDQKIKQLTTKNQTIIKPEDAKPVKESKKPNTQNPQEPRGRIKHQKSSIKELKPQFIQIKTAEQTSSSQLPQHNQKKSIEQLIEALLDQIKLDQTLRNLKIWFTFCIQTSKWDILKQKLANKKQFTNQQLKVIFQSNIEEHNPFFKWDSIEFNEGLQNLIEAYEKSNSHWQLLILNRWKRSSLQSSGLRQKIQYEKRNQVVALQDLVRFINLQKDTFFRNRDLYLIYKRLCQESNKLSYSRFLTAITQLQQQ